MLLEIVLRIVFVVCALAIVALLALYEPEQGLLPPFVMFLCTCYMIYFIFWRPRIASW